MIWTTPKSVQDRRRFATLPLEQRMRNTCPGCGCRLIPDTELGRAIEFVTGPPKRGQCRKCGWIGVK